MQSIFILLAVVAVICSFCSAENALKMSFMFAGWGRPAILYPMNATFSNMSFLFIGLLIGLSISALSQRLQFEYLKNFLFGKGNQKKNEDKKIRKKPDRVPKHIAVIMDGNRRFGRANHSDPLQGHWAGGQTLVDFAQWCMSDGVEILTVFAFSTENWNRDPDEVKILMNIFAKYAESFRQEALNKNVKVKVLSTDMDKLPVKVRHSITELEEATEKCSGFLINICLSYGGRAEIVRACQQIVSDALADKVTLEKIDENLLSSHLTTGLLPEPDILIRTSGEFRISNFLLWQLAYTELFFMDKYWPEITQKDLRDIMCQYSERSRRFGV